nr:immunoglobulin light chain junction region [Macaca mulatta]MOX82959.1 immunoglobulin light chain junction region [Macaca mulatta]
DYHCVIWHNNAWLF